MKATIIFENSRRNIQISDLLRSALIEMKFECLNHKILDSGRIFPELSDESNIVVYIGYNEENIPHHSSLVISFLPSKTEQTSNLNYRFIQDRNQFLMQNVSDIPLNAKYSAHDFLSVAHLISKAFRDKRSISDATISR